MTRVLTTWKEVAQYLGKGIRTAQRWEKELGLPVRRPGAQERNIVFVSTDELDDWLRHPETRVHLDIGKLRERVRELEVENELLRGRVASVRSDSAMDMHERVTSQGEALQVLSLRCARLQDISAKALASSREMRRRANQ